MAVKKRKKKNMILNDMLQIVSHINARSLSLLQSFEFSLVISLNCSRLTEQIWHNLNGAVFICAVWAEMHVTNLSLAKLIRPLSSMPTFRNFEYRNKCFIIDWDFTQRRPHMSLSQAPNLISNSGMASPSTYTCSSIFLDLSDSPSAKLKWA